MKLVLLKNVKIGLVFVVFLGKHNPIMRTTLLVPIVLFSFLLSCSLPSFLSKKYRVEHDDVKKSMRYIYEGSYSVMERDNPVVWLGKTFYRERDSLNKSKSVVYDFVKLISSARTIDSLMYLVTDTKTYTIEIKNLEKEFKKEIDTDTEKIIKADSTKIDVITGYNEYYYQIFKFNYTLTDDMIQAIIQSKQIKFRYYSGLSMITVVIKNQNLDKIKEVLGQ